jgi:hypothetical protein
MNRKPSYFVKRGSLVVLIGLCFFAPGSQAAVSSKSVRVKRNALKHRSHNTAQSIIQDSDQSTRDEPGTASEPSASQVQQEQPHSGHDMSKMEPGSSQQMPAGHQGHNMAGMDMMTSVAGGPFKTMMAIGSGTSLEPADSPGYMWHFMKDAWMVMLHGNLTAGVNHQGHPRGVNKAESMNWFMAMAEHPLAGGGAVLLKGMFSGEPFTSPNGGFPELFQTGETWRKKPIIDAQHPHDLFMELSATFTMPLAEYASVYVYGGPVAEPALGPAAFMHRASASEDPAAPIGHHWQDSTHISFGVFTAGANLWRFRVEGSVFNGREPDEDRKDIDFAAMDSWSARVWFTPTRNWSVQYSHGHLQNPEVIEPGIVQRDTASISYDRQWAKSWWATTFIWGRNHERRANSNAYLFESTVNFLNMNYLFTRVELVDKAGLLEENIFGRAGLDQFVQTPIGLQPGPRFDQAFRVGAFTFGGVRDLIATNKLRLGLGADITLYHVPRPLEQIYGSAPTSAQFWVRIKPGRMEH